MNESISEPLSLEDQCLLHLICHLEEYLPETLASLPLHLRHRLLLNLPAADICQLENTAVTAGIDMEGTVWQKVTKGLFCFPLRVFSVLKCRQGSHAFVSAVCALSIDGQDLNVAKELLFSVELCVDLNLRLWGQRWHHFVTIDRTIIRLRPYFSYLVCFRHKQHFDKRCSEAYVLSLMVEKCQRFPTELFIQDVAFRRSGLWKERDSAATVNLIRKIFSQVQNLTFENGSKDVVDFVLAQVFSNPQPSLSRLAFDCHRYNAITAVAKSLSKFGNPLASSQPNVPYYRGISTLAIDIGTHSGLIDHKLQSMMQCQSSLTSVSLHGIGTLSIPLVSTLGSLFYRPQFRELKLCKFSFQQENFTALLPQFVSAPTDDHGKALILQNIQLSDLRVATTSTSGARVNTGSDGDGGDVRKVPQKCLIVQLRPSESPLNLFRYLSSYYTHLLSSLNVDTGDVDSLYYGMCPKETIFPSMTLLRHVRLSSISLTHQPSPVLSFINLFQSPHLKSVHFVRCRIGLDGLLPALTKGLQKQVSVGTLRELGIPDNDLRVSEESELHAFFDVVFSLQHLSSIKLNLTNNGLWSQHYTVMYDSWKMNGEQQMKQLDICDKIHMDRYWYSRMQLQQMAATGDFLRV